MCYMYIFLLVHIQKQSSVSAVPLWELRAKMRNCLNLVRMSYRGKLLASIFILYACLLNPAHALHAGVSCLHFVCVFPCANLSITIELINFIFGGGLPSGPRKTFKIEKKNPLVQRWVSEAQNLGLMMKN